MDIETVERNLTAIAKNLGITPTQAGFPHRPHLDFEVSWLPGVGFGFLGRDGDEAYGTLLGRSEQEAKASIKRIAGC